jgi:aminopeptidase N
LLLLLLLHLLLLFFFNQYFHNWTGNRVTCRDWFQLTLKEGLTVFRDQEFSGDLNSKPVNRIENVKALRARQFAEDASPMSHPIRPESYISMDNFYTATVYEKGAEVIRMYQTILTVDGFNKGIKLYFERHDGQAVTCVDFLTAMADANNVDLQQFARWYETSGTPTVTYSSSLNAETKEYSVTLSQSSKSDPLPLHIPISFGLLDKATAKEIVPTTVLELKEMTQTFSFTVPASATAAGVVPSLLRDFSAPVKLVAAASAEEEEAETTTMAKEKELEDLAFLAAHDTDGFNRWEACQKLATSLIFQTLEEQQTANSNDNVDKKESSLQKFVEQAFGRTLAATETTTDYSIQAYALLLPTESTLAEEMDLVDPIGLHKARGTVKKALARKFQNELLERYQQLTADINAQTEFKVDATAIGQRRLRNVLLEYLCSIRSTEQEQLDALQLAKNHFDQARGMTDKMASLSALASMHEGPGVVPETRDAALQQFYQEANGDALVLNKWFTIQALADLPDVLDRVKKLTQHPDFLLTNPNRLRSLVGAFGMNTAAFHDVSGAGYEFLYDMLSQIDPLNPQVSSRMASNLISWRRYDEARGALMKSQLERLLLLKDISPNLFEVVNRGLQ